MTPYEQFTAQVSSAGLSSRWCSDGHWQIHGGKRIVNVWPRTKRGPRFQAIGFAPQDGGTRLAIQAAGVETLQAGQLCPYCRQRIVSTKRMPVALHGDSVEEPPFEDDPKFGNELLGSP